MARTLRLVHARHPILRRHADWVGFPHDRERQLAAGMAEALSRSPGIALAAPQVGHGLRLVVWVDAGVHALVDPLVHPDGITVVAVEGCLSLPGRWFEVERRAHVTVVGLDLAGRRVAFEATGLQARMWQHEADHLDGKLISQSWPEVRVGA